MQRIQRLLSGCLFGGALLFTAQAFAPQGLSAQVTIHCDEAAGKIYCCSLDSAGKIVDCKAVVAQ